MSLKQLCSLIKTNIGYAVIKLFHMHHELQILFKQLGWEQRRICQELRQLQQRQNEMEACMRAQMLYTGSCTPLLTGDFKNDAEEAWCVWSEDGQSEDSVNVV